MGWLAADAFCYLHSCLANDPNQTCMRAVGEDGSAVRLFQAYPVFTR